MGLDRISLKPIPSSRSGNNLAGAGLGWAGDDGKLFVVKLISLLSPPVPPVPAAHLSSDW